MRIMVWQGDIADAPADAVCTSTNPRLSLMMGTGSSVRDRGGFEILRACEKIVADYSAGSGRHALPAGSVHVTTAGQLPYAAIIHCVACDASHRSSPEVIQVLVKGALRAAEKLGCKSVAMPLFATGHARVPFLRAAQAMKQALDATPSTVEEVLIVTNDAERAGQLRNVFV